MATNVNLACSVHQHSLSHPDLLAAVGGKVALTYAQLAGKAAGIATCLQQNANLARRRDGALPRVGVIGSRSVEACVAMLGACWAGATYVPIGPKLPEDRVLAILSQCDLSAIIADDAGAKLLTEAVLAAGTPLIITPNAQALCTAPAGVTVIDIESVFAAVADAGVVALQEPAPVQPEDLAYIIFTSGTTGVPKGVMIPYSAVTPFLLTMSDLLGLTAEDRVLETCELTFDVSVNNMFVTWAAGASLFILPATQVMNAVKFARVNELTVWNSVPTLIGMLRQIKVLTPGSLPSMRAALFAGEPLTQGVVQMWRDAAPDSTIYDLYGPTEATVFCMLQVVGEPPLLTPGRDLIAIGKPLPGCEAAVVDAKGSVVPDGSHGELAMAGVQLATGYLNAEELTASRFPTLNGKRWYLTGDLAMRDASGVFHCFGRIDNQVKIAGNRVELEEIEAHLRNVTKAEVVGVVAHPIVGGLAQGVVAFIGGTAVDSAKVIAELKTKMPGYMVPSKVIALEQMPVNQSGKVDRRALRARLEADPA